MNKADVKLFTTCGNKRRKKQIAYFVDKNHDVMDKYYEVLESADGKMTALSVIKSMEKLIKEDVNFLDPYNEIANIAHENEDSKLEEIYRFNAYLMAVTIVADKDGNYPKEMYWGHMENRHIIRALCNFAYFMWEQKRKKLALEIFQKLLRSNLHDNIGARNYILAIRMGLSPNFEDKFSIENSGFTGLDARGFGDWFDKNSIKYPEEFSDYFLFNSREKASGWD